LAGSDSGLTIELRRKFDEPFLIGVISDTHLHQAKPGLALAEVVALFQRFEVDLIVHAGDVNSLPVLNELSRAAPLLVVAGNNDDADVMAIASDEIQFDVGRFRFAVLHGHGGASARSEAKRRFGGKVDCVIYGHSHIPLIEKVEGTIFFNPGSSEQRRWHPHFGLGLVAVANGRINPELVLWERAADLAGIKPN
jgi:uncharacterized protein